MGVLFSESWDSYGATADLSMNGWNVTSPWAWASGEGRLGGGAIKVVNSSATILSKAGILGDPGGNTEVGTAFWMKCSAIPSANFNCMTYNTSSAAYIIGMSILASTGYVDAGGSINVADNQWHWIEYAASGGNSGTATTRIWVDGSKQRDWSQGGWGYGTPGIIDRLAFGGRSDVTLTIGAMFSFDSSLVSSMPLGAKHIVVLRPTSDDSVQFSRSAGADNYALVSDSVADDDSTYVEDGTSGHADEYGYDNLPFVPSSILAVQQISRVKNPDVGSISFKQRCHSGATTSDGTSTAAPSNYQNFRRIYDQDPNTSSPWTATNLDAAKFGVTVV